MEGSLKEVDTLLKNQLLGLEGFCREVRGLSNRLGQAAFGLAFF